MLSWLAGEQWRTDVFVNNGDIYCASASAMFGVSDEQVKLRIFEEKQQAAAEEFDEEDPDAWEKQLQYEKRSMEMKNNLHNITLIMQNDENQGAYSTLASQDDMDKWIVFDAELAVVSFTLKEL